MAIVVIVVMCVVAVGVSFSRISALRARNRREREEAQTRATVPPNAPENSAPKDAPKATFADYLDAENAPTLTRAQLDEWRRDFTLACKYGRRPIPCKAPFMQALRAEGFALAYKSPLPCVVAVACNRRALPQSTPQKSVAASCRASYKAYIKSDEPAPVMR